MLKADHYYYCDMRSGERDLRLLILAATAGSADGWSYFGLGHAFVANMTGNTVLLGIAVFQNHGDMLHPALSLGCYATGAVIGSLLTRDVPAGAVASKTISWTLLLEALVLLSAEAGWIAIHLHAGQAPNLNLLLGTVALAIGIQSAAMVQVNIPGIVTTYITGTWTTMLTGLVRLARPGRPPRENPELEERLLMQAAVLGVYFLAAVLTGWLFRHLPLAVGALPGLSLLLVAVLGFLRPQKP
jgi:uncharacterized membrane protein YoaK (UPF0700 family)